MLPATQCGCTVSCGAVGGLWRDVGHLPWGVLTSRQGISTCGALQGTVPRAALRLPPLLSSRHGLRRHFVSYSRQGRWWRTTWVGTSQIWCLKINNPSLKGEKAVGGFPALQSNTLLVQQILAGALPHTRWFFLKPSKASHCLAIPPILSCISSIAQHCLCYNDEENKSFAELFRKNEDQSSGMGLLAPCCVHWPTGSC